METITQRVVRADGAAPVATKAARDVFSLASQAASEASTPPASNVPERRPTGHCRRSQHAAS